MPVPVSQMFSVASYLLKQKLRGEKRFPLVLMLEPLFRCNLACAGCGKIQYPAAVLKHQLSVEECLQAVDECPAPVVAIPGGEPLMHPDIHRIVAGIVARGRYVYMCTNALLLEEKLDLFQPSRYLSFSVHLDGDAELHDASVCREGTYEVAVRAIREAIRRGFRITTNTTLFDGSEPKRIQAFFDTAMALGVEGMMVSPGYAYDKAPDQEHFLGRRRTHQLFRSLLHGNTRRWRFNQSPLFLEFLAGTREYECTPWGSPCYSVFGWQKPCYLLQDGYAKSYQELLETTKWERYGRKSGNPRCQNCMMHCGFEPSSVEHAFSSWGGLFAMARAFLFGPQVLPPAARAAHAAPRRAEAPAQATPAPGRGFSAAGSPESLRAAFEYRGDVTLTLDDGSRVEGFVANLSDDSLELWEQGSTRLRALPRVRVSQVELSGRDPASGQSYQTWLRRSGRAGGSAAPPAG